MTTTIANTAFDKLRFGGVIAIAKTFTVKNTEYAIVTEQSTVKTGSNSVSTTINHGLRDAKGNWIIPLGTYSEISPLTDIFIKVKKRNLFGLVTVSGKEILPTEMEALESAGTGYLKYKINGFWGVMNYTGKIIIDTDRGYTSIGDFKTFNKRFPYTMTGYKGECDMNGRQVSKIKVETPQQTVTTQTTTTTTPQRQEEQKIIIEHKHDPIPVNVWVQCNICGGSGRCQTCGGSGIYTGPAGNKTLCSFGCGGSGKCSFCAGSGGHYEVEYK